VEIANIAISDVLTLPFSVNELEATFDISTKSFSVNVFKKSEKSFSIFSPPYQLFQPTTD
jgi:hypothetical protein